MIIFLKKNSKFAVMLTDMLTIIFTYVACLAILGYGRHGIRLEADARSLACLVVIYGLLLYVCKLYDSLWRYAELREFSMCVGVSLVAGIIYAVVHHFFIQTVPFNINCFIALAIAIALVSYRFVYRQFRQARMRRQLNNDEEKIPILVIGAGSATTTFLSELQKAPNCNLTPVCVVDDNPSKQNKYINGIYVCGSIEDVPWLCEKYKVKGIYVCIPSVSLERKKEILDICQKTGIHTKILPEIFKTLAQGESLLAQMRPVSIDDLLGREQQAFDCTQMEAFCAGKVVLVTGGGGSIGSELCRQISRLHPKKLIVLDIYENNAYDLQQEFRLNGSKLQIQVEIASVRDVEKMDEVFRKHRPQLVFHAAAHKHVPLMEHNPEEAVKNNVFGTYIVSEACIKYGVEKFVLVSTDKAVNPTNVMGATKRLCEMIVQSKNGRSATEFVAVRFGNVLGSNGSVIPLFKRQIERGGPVTVTDPEMIRFFMTIPEAAQLVLQAGSMAKGGEIFVLDMGEPVKILSLAERLITLSGFRPYKDIDIRFSGLRPGEKLYEEVLMDEEGLSSTANERIHIGHQLMIEESELNEKLAVLKAALETKDPVEMIQALAKTVPTYSPDWVEYKKSLQDSDEGAENRELAYCGAGVGTVSK